MCDHDRGLPALGRRLLLEHVDSEDVVDVPVRVDGRVEAARVPSPDLIVNAPRSELVAGVDEDEPVIGRERRHPRERRDVGGSVCDLGQA